MTELVDNIWILKTRHIIMILLLVLVLYLISWPFISQVLSFSEKSPMSEVLPECYLYILILFLLRLFGNKASVTWASLFGKIKTEYLTGKYIMPVLPLFGISIFCVYLVFYPLSFMFPSFINDILIMDETKSIWLNGDNYKLANVLSFFSMAVLAPVAEEILFRGFLLTSIAKKWNITKAVIITSLLFGLFHTDLLGSMIFGIVAAVFYLKTKSLFAPIILHAANNTVVFIIAYFSTYSGGDAPFTVTDFQSYWWIGLISMLLGIPWLMYFYRKEIKGKSFSIPYSENIKLHKEKVQG